MKFYFISEKITVQVISGICGMGDDMYLAGLQIPNRPAQNCGINIQQNQPLFDSAHSCLELSS